MTTAVSQTSVWLMACDAVSPALRQCCLAVLSESEHARHASYSAPAARDRFLLGRAMVRLVLSRRQGGVVAPEAWLFGHNEHGRPHVVSPVPTPSVHFNLTHTRSLLALIVGQSEEVGIDAECLDRPLSIEAVAANYFAPLEQALISEAAPARRRAVFFEIWTLREAYAKARGLGLTLPLDSYRFRLDAHAARLECDERCDDDADRWRFHRFKPTPQHVVSIAQAGLQADAWPPSLNWLSDAELQAALT